MWSIRNLKDIALVSCFLTLTACSSFEVKIQDIPIRQGDEVKQPEVELVEGAQPQSGELAAVDPMQGEGAPAELQLKFHDAVEAMNSGDLERALQLFKALQLDYPKYSGAYLNEANILYRQGKWIEALEVVDTTILVNKKNYYAYNLKGAILRQLGEFKDAEQSYLRAVDIYPDYPLSYLNLGILYDIYLYQANAALKSFEQYQIKSESRDEKVDGWIVELKRRLAASGEVSE